MDGVQILLRYDRTRQTYDFKMLDMKGTLLAEHTFDRDRLMAARGIMTAPMQQTFDVLLDAAQKDTSGNFVSLSAEGKVELKAAAL